MLNVKNISSWWFFGRSSKFCGLLIHQRRGDRAVGSGGFLSYACYCLSLLSGWCVVYVGDASVIQPVETESHVNVSERRMVYVMLPISRQQTDDIYRRK
jgi:hypothetical protein